MLEVDKKLYDLLKKGATFSKLKTKTGLCSSDVVRKVHSFEDKGYQVHRVFNEAGAKFRIMDTFVVPLQDNIEIPTSGKISFVVIADTHFGNIYENIEIVNKIYKYAEKNNIRYVFHLGDMIEGTPLASDVNHRIKRYGIHEQLDYVTRNYPKNDHIDTLYILGNHDYRCLTEGIDISKVLNKRRLDMHFLGYKNSKIKIGNINILLHHPFTIDKEQKYDAEIKELYGDTHFDLILRGHTHHNYIYTNNMDSLVINVPACYSSPSRNYTGVYVVTLKQNIIELNSLIVGKEVLPFGVIRHELKNKVLTKNIENEYHKKNKKN